MALQIQPLKPNEKKMAIILGVIAFVFLNGILFMFWNDSVKGVDTREAKLRADITRLKGNGLMADELLGKKAFVDKTLEPYASPDGRDQHLNSIVNDLANKRGLILTGTPKSEVKREQYFHKSAWAGKVVGEWTDVLDFIYDLQAPSEFRVVTEFDLKAQKRQGDDAATDVTCTFEIEKWWHPASADETIIEDGAADAPPAETPPADAAAATPEQNPAPAVPDSSAPAPAAGGNS